MNYDLKEIAELVGGELYGENRSFGHLITDSRSISHPVNSLFIAIEGIRHDGHTFIGTLLHKGVKCFLVGKSFIGSLVAGASFIIVDNTTVAFQKLVSFHRSKLEIPVIGITGSNGKTIVKEWLRNLLNDDYIICANPKSYNSQIGVPLSVWQLNEQHTMGIFEAGISRMNEMQNLEEIIRPTIGVLTTIGPAHDEGFNSIEEKITEKIKLFKHCEVIVYCSDLLKADHLIKTHFPSIKRITWSKRSAADISVLKIEKIYNQSIIHALVNGHNESVTIPFTDEAAIENALTCWAVLLAIRHNTENVKNRFRFLPTIEMRLEMKQGINNCTLINDSYNADMGSLSIALDFLNQQKRHQKHTLILSDISQSGKEAEILYKELNELLTSKQVNRLIAIGEEIRRLFELFRGEKNYYATTKEFISEIRNIDFYNEAILLKGSRSFEFEQLNNLLQDKGHETQLIINLNNLLSNVNYYRSLLKKGTRLMAMVKAQSYGSGSFEVASLLQHNRVNYLAVAYADEGIELRKAGITLPIMVMSPEEESFNNMLLYNLEPEIYSFRVLTKFLEAVQHSGLDQVFIHLKIDTGMHRLGFLIEEIEALANEIKSVNTIRIASVFSHLSASDNPEFDDFTREQIASFEKSCQTIHDITGQLFMRHICNSGAITRFPEAHYEMVRLGIGMYGFGSTEEEEKNLTNVCTLKTRISQLKKVKSGETVGYNRSGLITQDKVIAILPLGYADGFSRKLSKGNGVVWIGEKPCNTIGNVCMDMCMVDVTNVKCEEGDEVIVFDDVNKVNQMAKALETIPYEVLTSISTRVKKVYLQE